jgi:hypothetical protein
VFWWTWSLRRRIIVLASLLVPVLVSLTVFVIVPWLSAPQEQTSTPDTTVPSPMTSEVSTTIVTAPVVQDEEAETTPVRLGVKLTPTVLELLPQSFSVASRGVVRDLVLPGTGPDERSIYVVHANADWEQFAKDYHVNFELSGLSSVLDLGIDRADLAVSGTEGGRRFSARLRLLPSSDRTVLVGTVKFLDPL